MFHFVIEKTGPQDVYVFIHRAYEYSLYTKQISFVDETKLRSEGGEIPLDELCGLSVFTEDI